MTKTRLAATVAVLTLTGALATAANPGENRGAASVGSGGGLVPIVFRSGPSLKANHAVYHGRSGGRRQVLERAAQ